MKIEYKSILTFGGLLKKMKLHCLKGDHKGAKILGLLINLQLDKNCQVIYLDPEIYLTDPNFQKISPHGKSPVLETEFGPFYETNTIMRFLVKTQEDRSLLGVSPREEALVDQWLEYISNELDPILQVLYFPYINLMDFDDRQEEALDNLKEELNHIELKVKGKKYLIGYGVSLADMALAVSLCCPFKTMFDQYLGDEFPNLKSWLGEQFNIFCLQKLPIYFRALSLNVTKYSIRERSCSVSVKYEGDGNLVENLRNEVSGLKERTIKLENQVQKLMGLVGQLMGEKGTRKRSPSPTKYSDITHSRSSSIRSFKKRDRNIVQRTSRPSKSPIMRKSTISHQNTRRDEQNRINPKMEFENQRKKPPQTDPLKQGEIHHKNLEMETSRFEEPIAKERALNDHRLTFASPRDQDEVKIDESHNHIDMRMQKQHEETEMKITHNIEIHENAKNPPISDRENHHHHHHHDQGYYRKEDTPAHKMNPLRGMTSPIGKKPGLSHRQNLGELNHQDAYNKMSFDRDSISIKNQIVQKHNMSYQMDLTPKRNSTNSTAHKNTRNSSSIPRVKESVKNIFQADETPSMTQKSSQKSFADRRRERDRTNQKEHQKNLNHIHNEMTEENYPSFSQASQIYDKEGTLTKSPKILKESEVTNSFAANSLKKNQNQNSQKEESLVRMCLAQPIIAQSYKTVDMGLLNLRAKINTAETTNKKQFIIEDFSKKNPSKGFFEISLTRFGLDSSVDLIDSLLRPLVSVMLTANVCEVQGKSYVVSGVLWAKNAEIQNLNDEFFVVENLMLEDLNVEKRILAALTHVMRTPAVKF